MVNINLIEAQDHQMYVFPGGDMCPLLVANGVYHPKMTQVVKETVREGMTCVDVGAHIGYFTLIMAKLVGQSGRVFAFEPEPNNFQLLRRNIEINGYDTIFPFFKAVSNINGTAILYVDKLGMGSHSLAAIEGGSPIEVEVGALDSFFSNTHPIDFIKVDVEGAEMAVFQGMKGIIERNKHLTIITEFLAHGLLALRTQPKDFLEAIQGYGFTIYDIGEGERPRCPVSPGQPTDIDDLIEAYPPGTFTNLLLKRRANDEG